MTSVTDYALMSANVYGNSPDVRREQNTLPEPEGWTPLNDSTYKVNDTSTGFMARVYVNGSEVVISYCGTTDENYKDWYLGNIPAGIGTDAPQVLQAADLYMKVANDPQFAGKSISFTGHSLGGGLASLMAVWFDRPATVFDEAFFSKSADSDFVLSVLKNHLTSQGYTLPNALATYQTDTSLSSYATNSWAPSPTRLARQAQVHNVSIKGEVLSVLSNITLNNLGNIVGSIALALGLSLIHISEPTRPY